MTTDRTPIAPPNASTDQAPNRPRGLPRRQRLAGGVASAVISAVLLGGIVYGMAGADEGLATMAGEPAGATFA
jgi:ferric-dicitrate binding protein FerR (iron transport regulator)